MKHTVHFLLVALFCLVSFTGCDKDKLNAGTMTAMVNGSAFTAANCSHTNTGGWIVLKGISGNNEAVTIYIKAASLAQTTYNFEGNMQDHHANYDDGKETHHAATGSVTINSINGGVNVSGSYHFNCTDKTVVTDGLFTALF